MNKFQKQTQELINNLKYGEVLMTTIRKVMNRSESTDADGNVIEKYQFELVEVSPPDPSNALAVFNSSDPMFNSRSLRYAWMTTTKEDFEALTGIEIKDESTFVNYERMSNGPLKVQPLNVLNPRVGDLPLRIQIMESVTPTPWQADNMERSVKLQPESNGNPGGYLFKEGLPIFRTTTVVLGSPQHVLIAHDEVRQSLTGARPSANLGTFIDTRTAAQIAEDEKPY